MVDETNSSDEQGDNIWHHQNMSNLVLVFIHGLMSNSSTCWKNEQAGVYWPDLVLSDSRFGKPSIFLAGYYTDTESGGFDIQDAARSVYDVLREPDSDDKRRPVDYPSIVFVCHSLGGLVARELLVSHRELFLDKDVGLLLIASPAKGSRFANRLAWIAKAFNHRQAKQLEWENDYLSDLDKRFRDALDKLPRLRGRELYENHFIGSSRWNIVKTHCVIVKKESAAVHFSGPRLIPDTDHFTCVKPSGHKHDSHRQLLLFLSDKGFLDRTVSPEVDEPATSTLQFKVKPDVVGGAIRFNLNGYEEKDKRNGRWFAEITFALSSAVKGAKLKRFSLGCYNRNGIPAWSINQSLRREDAEDEIRLLESDYLALPIEFVNHKTVILSARSVFRPLLQQQKPYEWDFGFLEITGTVSDPMGAHEEQFSFYFKYDGARALDLTEKPDVPRLNNNEVERLISQGFLRDDEATLLYEMDSIDRYLAYCRDISHDGWPGQSRQAFEVIGELHDRLVPHRCPTVNDAVVYRMVETFSKEGQTEFSLPTAPTPRESLRMSIYDDEVVDYEIDGLTVRWDFKLSAGMRMVFTYKERKPTTHSH